MAFHGILAYHAYDERAVTRLLPEVYLVNGAELGWLSDPEQKRAYIYRPQAAVEKLENPNSLSGDPLLPGFILDLREIWEL